MKRFYFSFALIFLISSCAPAATVTISPTTTLTATIIPTSTYTLTPSPTVTPTMTPTITPTPLGGGSGQIVCSFCNGKPGISLINFDGTGEIYLTDKINMGASFDWSRNGAKLGYFSVTGSEGQEKYLTCVIDAHGYNEQCFEIGGGNFSLSPDGSKMAIGGFSSTLTLVDFDSGKSEILMEAPIQWSSWDVDWSPDGTKLAAAGGGIGIIVINIMNNEKFVAVEGDKPDYYNTPRWSPDGKKIVYVKHNNLFIVNADGSDETLLVRNAFYPIWSHDGTKIAYFAGSNNIIMMNIDGTNKIRLTPSQSLVNMTWSLDSKFIIYTVFTGSRANPSYDLYSVEVANQEMFSLAKNTGDHPTLSPDGSMIIYTTEIKSEDKYIFHTYLATMDGAIISELNIPGVVGPWRPTTNSDENVSFTPLTKEQSWEFDTDGDTEGWKDIQNINQLQVSNGYLKIEAVEGISWMRSHLFILDANDFSKIEIRMKIDGNSPVWLGFITSTDLSYDAPKTNGFDAIGDGQFHTYIIDMSKFMTWKGIIRQIQFKPVEKRTSIEIDYIRILP